MPRPFRMQREFDRMANRGGAEVKALLGKHRPDLCFAVVIFDPDEDEFVACESNGSRDDLIRTLRRVVELLELHPERGSDGGN